MTIMRNGELIELSANELYAAYLEQRDAFNREDVLDAAEMQEDVPDPKLSAWLRKPEITKLVADAFDDLKYNFIDEHWIDLMGEAITTVQNLSHYEED